MKITVKFGGLSSLVMPAIKISHLKRYFDVLEKESGIRGSINSFFHRRTSLVKALDDISFEIEEGELVGFIGPNGAGKTTTLKCLTGLLYPTSGNLKVLGFDPFQRQKKFLSQISLVMGQKNQLWWDLPALESLLLNKEIYEIPQKQFDSSMRKLTEMLQVTHLLKIPVRKLSLGERMKMELIASLIHRPKVLFLDEPTIGLDVIAQKNIRDFIKGYNREFGATIILTSHYMRDVKELCQRVIVIDKGRIIYDGLLSKIAEKFSGEKILKVDFVSKDIDPNKFKVFGRVKMYQFPTLILAVKREEANKAVARILNDYQVADLTLSEIDIEEVIRLVFSNLKPKETPL